MPKAMVVPVLPSAAAALLACAVYALAVGLSPSLSYFLFLPPLCAFIFAKNRLGLLKRVLFLNIFLLFVFACYYFGGQGEYGWLMLLRSNLIVLFSLCLFCASSYAHIAAGAASLGLGAKLVLLLFLSAKFIYEFMQDLAKFKLRLKARGFRAGTNLYTYQTYASFIANIIFLGLARAKKAELCLRARGFNAKAVAALNNKMSLCDYLWLGLSFGALALHFGVLVWF